MGVNGEDDYMDERLEISKSCNLNWMLLYLMNLEQAKERLKNYFSLPSQYRSTGEWGRGELYLSIGWKFLTKEIPILIKSWSLFM